MKCQAEKAVEMMSLLERLQSMSGNELQVSIFTALTMCTSFDQGKGATKDRERFTYYAPFLGSVYKTAFESFYGISHQTLHLYRKRVQ